MSKEFRTEKLLNQDLRKIVDMLKMTDVKKLTVKVTKHDDGSATVTFTQEIFAKDLYEDDDVDRLNDKAVDDLLNRLDRPTTE